MKLSIVRTIGTATALIMAASAASGFVLEGQSWTRDRTVQMQLSLGGNQALSDGFTSFNQSAQDALNVWNTYLAHMQFSAVLNSPVTPSNSDDEMSVLFSSTVFGQTFGSNTIAITILNSRGTVLEEADTLFNNAYTWDSYRGALRPGVIDFHRVAIHEFGHTLGLDHPDQHGQTVTAIMNADVSDIDTVQPDDIAGVQSIYSSGPAYQSGSTAPAPVMLNISTRAFVGTGDNVLIGGFIVQGSMPATVVLRAMGGSLSASGFTSVLEDPTITIYDSNNNVVTTNDDWFNSANGATIASYHLDPPNSIESAVYVTLNPGAYTAVVQSFSSPTQPAGTGFGLVEVYDLHTTTSRLGNISSRGLVGTGDNILIGGFIVGNGAAKTVVVRALGPTLADRGVANSLADPTLELRDGSGNLIAANDNWQQSPNAAAIQSEGLAPAHPSESALQVTVNPGNYTGLVRGVNNSTGFALIEIYDLSPAP
jgi:hypothetical protein